MRHRAFASRYRAGLTSMVLLIVSGPTAAGQIPRAPDGHADLHGIWNYSTITPLERPKELSGKEYLSDEEAAAIAKSEADNRSRANPATLEEARQNPGFGAGLEAPVAYEFR